jgi:type I restriction enzyme S subunit
MGEMFGFEFISDQDMSRVMLTNSELTISGLRDGDLLFGRRSVVPSGAGKCSLVLTPVEPITFESSIIRVRLNRAEAFPLFYYYFFASPKGRSTVGTIVSGTNIKGIRASELRELKVPLPARPEQEAIAEALSDADAFIESLEQLLTKKRLIKQGAMQDLLTGKKRLPGFQSQPGYKQTEVGVIPDDWEIRVLITLVDPQRSIRYGIVQPGKFDPQGRYMVRGQDYSFGWADPSEFFRVTALVEERYANARIKAGDILITIVGASTGRVAVVPTWLEGANLTQTTARIAVGADGPNSTYCAHVLSSWYGTKQVRNYIKGGAQPGLNCTDIEKFLIPLPRTRREQEAVAAVLSDMDAEIATAETKLTKARQIKQGMMQELLTGRTRLV